MSTTVNGDLRKTHGGLIENNVVRKARARCDDAAAGIWPFACENARFTNNLFIVEPGGRVTYDFKYGMRNVFENNLFCGRHVGLPTGVSLSPAPKLAASVKPTPGIGSLQGCRPADARTFPRGIIIKDNGGRDFFGNPLPTDRPPAIGAGEK